MSINAVIKPLFWDSFPLSVIYIQTCWKPRDNWFYSHVKPLYGGRAAAAFRLGSGSWLLVCFFGIAFFCGEKATKWNSSLALIALRWRVTRDVPADRRGEKKENTDRQGARLSAHSLPVSPAGPPKSCLTYAGCTWAAMWGAGLGILGSLSSIGVGWGGESGRQRQQAAKSRRKEVGDAEHGVPVGGFNHNFSV